jgi:Pectate lyase superfamily protein
LITLICKGAVMAVFIRAVFVAILCVLLLPLSAQAEALTREIAPRKAVAATFDVKVAPFNAAGDGVADDREAIQRAINAARDAGGGDVWLPAGTYRVVLAPRIAGETALRRVFTVYPNVRVLGVDRDASVIKLADNQDAYGAVFAMETFGADASGFELRALTVDQNTTGNPINSLDDVNISGSNFANAKIRAAVWLATGKNMVVQGCRFTDIKAVWTVFLGGAAERVEGITIADNLFENVGGGDLDFDTSQVYTETNGLQSFITNNTFVSRNGGNAGSLGLRTAIEVHGDNVTVEGNTVKGFLTGLNVGGAWPATNNIARNNRFENVNSGVILWADAVARDPTPDVVMRDILIEKNTFVVDVAGWQAAPLGNDATYAAVRIEQQGAKDRQLQNVKIVGNDIRFINVAGSGHEAGDRYSAGIHYNRAWFSNGNNLTTGLTISENTITDAPGMGIFINAPIAQGEISGNTIVNPGSSEGAKAWLGWQSGIFLQDRLDTFSVLNNRFSGADLKQGIYANNTVIGENVHAGNIVTDSTAPVFVRGTNAGAGEWVAR